MKRLALLAALVVAASTVVMAQVPEQRRLPMSDTVQFINGSWKPLGTVFSPDGGSFNNWQPDGGLAADGGQGQGSFDAGTGVWLMGYCTQPATVATGSGNAVVATGNDVGIAPWEKHYTLLRSTENTIAFRPQPDAGVPFLCRVYRGF